jgi:hypothetical protein
MNKSIRLNLIFVFLRCVFHALLLMLAAMFLMKSAYLQLNAMWSTWLQVGVPRVDGNSLHNYYPPCIDCLVLYIVIVFVGLICLWLLFLTLDLEYVDAAMLYPLFHCIYTLQFWLIRQVWFVFVNGYIHVNFYYLISLSCSMALLDLLLLWLLSLLWWIHLKPSASSNWFYCIPFWRYV